MNRLQTALADIGQLLDQRSFAWALIGGIAVSVRAEPRFMRDVDLAVAVEGDAEAERLVGDLRGGGYEILETVEQEPTGRLATARLLPPGGDPGGWTDESRRGTMSSQRTTPKPHQAASPTLNAAAP